MVVVVQSRLWIGDARSPCRLGSMPSLSQVHYRPGGSGIEVDIRVRVDDERCREVSCAANSSSQRHPRQLPSRRVVSTCDPRAQVSELRSVAEAARDRLAIDASDICRVVIAAEL